jgi:heme-degrading monooxygenase HmoA
MSVIMMLPLDIDAKKFEEFAANNADRMKAISDRALGHGLIAHRFLGNDQSGKAMVVDEWETPEGFQAFFDEAGEEIGAAMGEAGLSGGPGEPQFWRVLESHDKQGWES